MKPEYISFAKTLLAVGLISLLSYIGEANNLATILNPYSASIIAALANSLETYIKEQGGNALFGAVALK